MDWQPIESAPYGVVLLVRNKVMEKPVRATRGYVYNGMVHPDNTFFTSVWTPDEIMGFPSGCLVCPDEWTPFIPPQEPTHDPLGKPGHCNGVIICGEEKR